MSNLKFIYWSYWAGWNRAETRVPLGAAGAWAAVGGGGGVSPLLQVIIMTTVKEKFTI